MRGGTKLVYSTAEAPKWRYDFKKVLTWFFNIYNSIATVIINEKSLFKCGTLHQVIGEMLLKWLTAS